MKLAEEKYKTIDAGRVLDVATGRGEFIQVIKTGFKSYEHVIGIDTSEPAVKQAQTMFPENNIEILKMRADKIEYPDANFDTVCISNSLHHMENLPQVFAEMLRVLKPGGLFLISEMYCDGEQTEAQQSHILMHHWFTEVDRLNGIYHVPTYTRQQIKDFVATLPLQKVEVLDYYYPTDNPKDPALVDVTVKRCQELLKKLHKPETASLEAAGAEIVQRLQTIGLASPSRLLIVGRKKA